MTPLELFLYVVAACLGIAAAVVAVILFAAVVMAIIEIWKKKK